MAANDHNILGREEFPADLLQRPEPVQVRQAQRAGRHSRRREEYNEKDAPYSGGTYHTSVSSAGDTYHSDASIDLEKQASFANSKGGEGWSPRSSIRASRDTGRHHSSHDPAYQVGRGMDSSPHHQTIRHLSDDDEAEAVRSTHESPGSVGLLLYFICLLPFVAFAVAIWTLLLTLFLTLLHPVRLIFTRKKTYSQAILSALAPALNLHLGRIASFPTAAAELQLCQTLAVLTGSALVSIGVSVWAMVLGVFWIFAAVIGNPDGLDGRSDGRDLICTTRRKWDGWLRLSVRPELRS